jgi:hypothetical protein
MPINLIIAIAEAINAEAAFKILSNNLILPIQFLPDFYFCSVINADIPTLAGIYLKNNI